MPELLRSIVGRLRGFVANRRRAPRLKINLEASLALSVAAPGAKPGSNREQHSLRLDGYTFDISETGLALVVPSIRIGGQYLVSEDRLLQITLGLPHGAIEFTARPMRYVPLDGDAAATATTTTTTTTTTTGYIVGLQITTMGDDDRARYLAYIKLLMKGWNMEEN